jgi:hypothetical protein
MQGMNPIDEIFKSGLKEHGLDFKPEYEQRMNNLLDNQASSSPLMKVFSGLLIVCSIGLSIYALYSEQSDDLASGAKTSDKKVVRDFNSGSVYQKITLSEPNDPDQVEQSSSHTDMSYPSSAIPLTDILPQTNQTKAISNDGNNASTIASTSNRDTELHKPAPTPLGPIANKPLTAFFNTRENLSDEDIVDYHPKRKSGTWGLVVEMGSGWFEPNLKGNLFQNKGLYNHCFAGIKFQRKNIKIQSGVKYMNFSEKVSWTTDRVMETYDTTLYLVTRDHTTDPRGKSIALIGQRVDTSFTTETSTCENCINRLVYLSIPLELKYELRRGRMGLEFGGGVIGSFLIRGNGHVPITSAEGNGLRSFTKRDLSPAIWSTTGTIGLVYSLSKSTRVGLNYRRVNSFTNWNGWDQQSMGSGEFVLSLRTTL